MDVLVTVGVGVAVGVCVGVGAKADELVFQRGALKVPHAFRALVFEPPYAVAVLASPAFQARMYMLPPFWGPVGSYE